MPYHLAMSPYLGAERFPFPHQHMHTSSPVFSQGPGQRRLLAKQCGACGSCYILYIHKPQGTPIINGAGDGARTRYLHLGKVALYQMSYARMVRGRSTAHGASGRNRTNDTRIFSPLLYQLSYRGIWGTNRTLYKDGDPERARTVDLQRDRLAF